MSKDSVVRMSLLTDLTREELRAALAEMGQPAYRGDQVWGWLYASLAGDLDAMTTLPAALRAALAQHFAFPALRPVADVRSADRRTWKVLFELADGETIESVLMRYERRDTACISTQVGCAVGCSFCATGQSGFRRDLSAGEIVEQALFFARDLLVGSAGKDRLTNVVFMGMGEPLLNYEATWQAIARLNDPRGFNLGARHMTLSTSGVVPGIDRMAAEPLQVGLSVSLHATDDVLRDDLVPINRRYPLNVLLSACRRYVTRTNRRITFEYALMENINDSPEQALALARLVSGMLCHVNLIPANCTADAALRPSPRERVDAFAATLAENHIPTTVRLARGADIQAGCGQLRSREMKRRAP
jgi:23S rRNA (adenine2503-C2)-methyltransferase